MALSDGVFAIAITLLTFQLQVTQPLVNSRSWSQLASAISDIEPKLESYAITFLVLGAYWMGHHRLFRAIVRYDRRLLLLNLLYLLGVAFTPFPASLLGTYPHNPLAVVIYAGNLAWLSVLSGVMGWYAEARRAVRPGALGVSDGAVAGLVLGCDLSPVHASGHRRRPLGAVLLDSAVARPGLRDPQGRRERTPVTALQDQHGTGDGGLRARGGTRTRTPCPGRGV